MKFKSLRCEEDMAYVVQRGVRGFQMGDSMDKIGGVTGAEYKISC